MARCIDLRDPSDRNLRLDCRVALESTFRARVQAPWQFRPPSTSVTGCENQVSADLTTFTHGLPSTRRLILSAMVFWRRRIVPKVQPDMCGVITIFSSVWKGSVEGNTLGCCDDG